MSSTQVSAAKAVAPRHFPQAVMLCYPTSLPGVGSLKVGSKRSKAEKQASPNPLDPRGR
ncbi:MAG: hypothetical protein Q4D19_11760 [Lautropia sp.]|nr:hypothetical protein [Lautropia sp.]